MGEALGDIRLMASILRANVSRDTNRSLSDIMAKSSDRQATQESRRESGEEPFTVVLDWEPRELERLKQLSQGAGLPVSSYLAQLVRKAWVRAS